MIRSIIEVIFVNIELRSQRYHLLRERERERETERETDRQTDRQTEAGRQRQTDGQTNRYREFNKIMGLSLF